MIHSTLWKYDIYRFKRIHIGRGLEASWSRASMAMPMGSECITFPAHQCVHQSGSSSELWCSEFLLNGHDWLNHGPLNKIQYQAHCSLLQTLSACKSQPSNHVLGLSSDQLLLWYTKGPILSHFISIIEMLSPPRKSPGFLKLQARNLWQRPDKLLKLYHHHHVYISTSRKVKSVKKSSENMIRKLYILLWFTVHWPECQHWPFRLWERLGNMVFILSSCVPKNQRSYYYKKEGWWTLRYSSQSKPYLFPVGNCWSFTHFLWCPILACSTLWDW